MTRNAPHRCIKVSSSKTRSKTARTSGFAASLHIDAGQHRLCVAAAIAIDLLCWLRLLCLTGPLADAEPKTLRYQLLHTAVRLALGHQRKRKIKIPETWPWADALLACFTFALALAPPGQVTESVP
jgi:hypothetical protein